MTSEISRSLYFNILFSMFKKIKNSQLPNNEMEEILDIFFLIHKKALHIFNNLKVFYLPGDDITDLENSLTIFGKVLTDISISLKNKNLDEACLNRLKDILDRIFLSCDNLSKNENKISHRELLSSPFFNELIAIARIVLNDNKGKEVLASRIGFLKKFLYVTKKQIEYLISGPDSVTVQCEALSIFTSFNYMEEGLNEIELYFQDNIKEHIINGMEKIKDSSGKLVRVKEALKEAFGLLFNRFCINCGNDNDNDFSLCSLCSFNLPSFSQDFSLEKVVTEENFSEPFPRGIIVDTTILNIINRAEVAYGGLISYEDFNENLVKFELKVNVLEKEISFLKMPLSENNPLEHRILGELFLRTGDAIRELRDGINLFRLSFEKGKRENFILAWKKIILAGGFIHQIQNICEIAERKIN